MTTEQLARFLFELHDRMAEFFAHELKGGALGIATVLAAGLMAAEGSNFAKRELCRYFELDTEDVSRAILSLLENERKELLDGKDSEN